MNSARWVYAQHAFDSAVRHFHMVGVLYRRGGFDDPDPDGYANKSAFTHAILSGHSSMEAGLKRILGVLREPLPTDREDSHAALLAQVFAAIEERGPILPPDLFESANETRKARHLAVHGYDTFDPAEVTKTVEAAKVLAEHLPESLRAFIARIDPPEHDDGGDGSGTRPG